MYYEYVFIYYMYIIYITWNIIIPQIPSLELYDLRWKLCIQNVNPKRYPSTRNHPRSRVFPRSISSIDLYIYWHGFINKNIIIRLMYWLRESEKGIRRSKNGKGYEGVTEKERRWEERRWEEMRGEMRWEEMRGDEMRGDEMRWEERRWD